MPLFAFVREIWNIKPCVHDPPDFCDISDKKKKKKKKRVFMKQN
jgi:hypothetical protein